jgi:hypothetical protein
MTNYGAEHYSTDHQLLGHSIVSQHFMEPKGLIPNSQELSTCSCPCPSPRLYLIFHNKCILYVEVLLAPRPTPKREDHPVSFGRGSLFNIFAATVHSWRPSLHPQPEDSPWCGDRDPPNMDKWYKQNNLNNISVTWWYEECEVVTSTLNQKHGSQFNAIMLQLWVVTHVVLYAEELIASVELILRPFSLLMFFMSYLPL